MDERKWDFRKILKRLMLAFVAATLCIGMYGGFVFFKTQTIKDPKKCMITSMYKVNLCPSNSQYVKYNDVPKHFFQSLILSEDASFYSHKGFDWFEIKESFQRNFLEWKFARGGSTLTQQLAKNMYLTKNKSLDRKFQEFFIARQIESRLSKTQILEKYVNVVEFGDNIFGLKQASEHYFNKSPALLNVLESIYLVSLLPSPKRLGKSFEEKTLSIDNEWRMKIILKRLYRTHRISDEVFVYLEMLTEGSDWPFEQYSEDMFQSTPIEDQMLEAFDQTQEDEVYLENQSNMEGTFHDDAEEEKIEPPAGEELLPEREEGITEGGQGGQGELQDEDPLETWSDKENQVGDEQREDAPLTSENEAEDDDTLTSSPQENEE